MKWLILALALLGPAQAPPSVEVRWLSPRTAEVVWHGAGGVGVCVVKAGPPALVLTESCGEPSGAIVLGPGGDYLRAPTEGARFVLWNGTAVLAEATLGEPPRYEQRLVLVVAP